MINDTLELMGQVVTELDKKHGVHATVEYPGYIGLDVLSFGTANEYWGWSDMNGNSGESTLPPASPVEEIVTYILEVWCKRMIAKVPAMLEFINQIANMKTEEEFAEAPDTEDWILTLNYLIEKARKIAAETRAQ